MNSKSNATPVLYLVPNPATKWAKDKVLFEARRRTRQLNTDNSVRVQRMLDALVTEAGWTEEEFIDALCADVVRTGPLNRT